MKKLLTLLPMGAIVLCVILSSVCPVNAGIPKIINYQGMLTDNLGNPLNGSYTLTFKIYNSPSGGTLRWQETQMSVSVINGLFNIILGSITPINLSFDEDYWLDVTVGAEHMPTRLRFTSLSYTYRALIADSAVVALSAPTGGGWTDDGRYVRLQTASDSVCIGMTHPAYKLDVAGEAHASSFPTSSDARLKKNVTQLTNVLERLEKIRGVSFEWNELYESMGRSTGHREIGVIAQEVEVVFPELVTTWGEEQYRAIDYGRLTGVLIEAIKELKVENDVLRKRVELLESK